SGGPISDSIGLSHLQANQISLTSNSSITLTNPLSAPGGIVLFAGANSALTAQSIQTPKLALLAGTGGVNVVTTNATELILSTSGNATVTTTGPVMIGAAGGSLTYGNQINVSANGTITVKGPVVANDFVSFTSSGNNGSIVISQNLAAPNSITLTANGNGSI